MTKLTRALALVVLVGVLGGCGGGGGGGANPGPIPGGGSISWTRGANPAGGADRAEILYTGPDGTLYVGTQTGLFASSNRGQSWSNVNTGQAGTVNSIGINSSGEILAGIGTGAFRQTGGTWVQSAGITANLKVSDF